jgi:hypothetical protein
MKTIAGTEAIRLMREVSKLPDGHFTLSHLTYDRRKRQSDGWRQVKRCRLRPSLPNEVFATDSDLYLPYHDITADAPRLCFKLLIRFVGFAPNYELMKINWFTDEE